MCVLALQLVQSPFASIRSNGKVSSVAFLNAETVLHDYWGGPEYWMVRRSMRFNSFLLEVAKDFRREVLNSTDAYDATERPKDWRHETVRRSINESVDVVTFLLQCV